MINNLYYNSDDAPSFGLEIDNDLLASALASIYNRDYNPRKEIDPDLFRGVVDRLDEAITEGIADDGPDTAFVDALRHSAEVFAAFKVHKAQNDMAARLLDSNGRLKSFEQWSNDVQSIASHQFGPWLRTEYDTAVIRAHQAAEWQRFERDKDVLPNLRWAPSTSPNPGADHRIYWGTILPVDHPFWSRHRPGDRWNCQCSLESTDEPATGIKREDAVDPRKDGPHKGLGDNPGKSGSLFGQDHPYYPDSCSSCPFAGSLKNRLGMRFSGKKKDCNNCQNVDYHTPDADGFVLKNKYTNGGQVLIHQGADRSKKDHKAIVNIARHFAKSGEIVKVTPAVHFKSEEYQKIYGSLAGTKYERKCPDFQVGDKFYEYEGFEKPWNRRKVKSMISHGLKQSALIVIDNSKGCSDRFIHNMIRARLKAHAKIDEVYVYEKGKVRLLFSHGAYK